MRITFLIVVFFTSIFFKAQEKEILSVMNEQQNAWNNGDIEGYMNGYWKSDSLVFIGSKGPTYGWKKTLDNYKKSYPTQEKMGRLEFSDQKITKLGINHAFVIGKWKLIRSEDTPSGIYTLVFRKFTDGWKIISDHTN